MNFSILMSVYKKESPKSLHACLESLNNQTLKASDIVIVEDGPLTTALYDTLTFWNEKLPIVRVKLNDNVGLGKALNEGLLYCKYELVARMDTDDICDSQRFEKQLNEFKLQSIDVCGSCVSEFEFEPRENNFQRIVPQYHKEIVKLSDHKNPMNHPTVMYKKSQVISVGGYDDVLFFEDYHLWLKLLNNGMVFYNIPENLVYMKAGMGQLSRRGGIKYACYELSFFKICASSELLPKFKCILNVFLRFPLRIIPKFGLKFIYTLIRK